MAQKKLNQKIGDQGSERRSLRAALHHLFFGRSELLRVFWLWVLGFAVYFAWTWGVERLFGLIFGRLHLHAMNLAYGDVIQAPLWATMFIEGYDPLLSIVESLGMALIFYYIAKHSQTRTYHSHFDVPRMFRWAALGLAVGLGGSLLCVLTDSMRLALPLSEPDFSWSVAIALPMCFLSTLAGEIFMMDYLYDAARARMHRIPCILLLIVVEFVAEGGWHLSWIGMLNVMLQILVCCLLHEQFGLAAPTGLFFGWSFALSALTVNVSYGARGGLWSLYNVSEPWLTGGSHGIFDGVIMTALLLGVVAFLYLRSRRGQGTHPEP